MSQYFNVSINDLVRHKTAVATLLPVLLPTVYVVYLNWTVRRSTTCLSGTLSRDNGVSATVAKSELKTPNSLPDQVVANPSDWVVCYERVVSQPIMLATLADKLHHHDGDESSHFKTPSPLFTRYLRTTYKAFSWTPQAFLIRAMLAEQDRKQSFAAKYIDSLEFADGDIVDGVYKVTSYEHSSQRGLESIELSIDVPASYRGPPVRGLIMSSIEPAIAGNEDGAGTTVGTVLFVNETWLWRRKDEKATLLESAIGKWFHGLLAGWLVTKGLAGVARGV